MTMLNGAREKTSRGTRATTFAYHEVAPPHQLSRYSVSIERFASHVELFSQLVQRTQMVPVVTFDDGHMSNYTHALPALSHRSVRAIFFITTGHIGVKRDFMGWPEVRELVRAGHSIQAHGWSHCFLPGCSDTQLELELHRARLLLEDKLGSPVNELSLPGGRYDERILNEIAKAGYQRVYSSEAWAHRQVCDSLMLVGRVMVRREMTTSRMRALAHQTPVAKLRVNVEDAVRHAGRSMLGNENYHRVWSVLSGRQAAPSSLTNGRD
jgi:peptidoglycan/xylan/chitin deacetylase (PgdA/CDA1 family)